MPRILIAMLALLLAACSSLGPPADPARRALAPLSDDIAGMVVAFDLPRGLRPLPDASILHFDASRQPGRKIRLVEADADDIAASLPPPASGRAYYFYGLDQPDQVALKAAQAAARAAGLSDTDIAITIEPHLCRAAAAGPQPETVTVLAALPGGARLIPLIDRRLVSELAGTAALADCP